VREASGQSQKAASSAAATPIDAGERILLLEVRLEKAGSALAAARADADRLRNNLAESAAREADHARRSSLVQQELADARAELVSLHERLGSSEALRAELEGHLFEAGTRGDRGELLRLRRELLAQQQRSLTSEQTAARLRARVDELLLSRDTLLARVAEWQLMVGQEESGAVDLAEFISELRRDIMMLEQRNAASDRQEAALRERLARAGLDPDAPLEKSEPVAEATESQSTAEAVGAGDEIGVEAIGAAEEIEARAEAIGAAAEIEAEADWSADPEPVRANGSGSSTWAGYVNTERGFSEHEEENQPVEAVLIAVETAAPSDVAAHASVDGLMARDPAVRAAAYERLIQVHEGSPAQLTDHVRAGLADADPRVRRRTVLAAATNRSVVLSPLLDPLRGDPDPHVRRVVREVLRHKHFAE
jgi:hypothetical protein